MPGDGPYKIVPSPGAKIMGMEKTISGHLAIPCGEWDARQRADVVLGRDNPNTTSFTIEVPGSAKHQMQSYVEQMACKPCNTEGHLRGNVHSTPTPGASSSSHGNVPPPTLVEPPPPARPKSPSPAMPERRPDGRPERTLED